MQLGSNEDKDPGWAIRELKGHRQEGATSQAQRPLRQSKGRNRWWQRLHVPGSGTSALLVRKDTGQPSCPSSQEDPVPMPAAGRKLAQIHSNANVKPTLRIKNNTLNVREGVPAAAVWLAGRFVSELTPRHELKHLRVDVGPLQRGRPLRAEPGRESGLSNTAAE